MSNATTVYEIGPNGRGPTATCATLEDLLAVAPLFPPGEYWITATDVGESLDGTAWLETTDWGTLVVRSKDDWILTSGNGFTAGPGYLIA